MFNKIFFVIRYWPDNNYKTHENKLIIPGFSKNHFINSNIHITFMHKKTQEWISTCIQHDTQHEIPERETTVE